MPDLGDLVFGVYDSIDKTLSCASHALLSVTWRHRSCGLRDLEYDGSFLVLLTRGLEQSSEVANPWSKVERIEAMIEKTKLESFVFLL
jgi:hypothetical protein